MYRVLGLGNFGEEYQDTPHNIGKQVMEIFLKNNQFDFFSSRFDKKKRSEIFKGKFVGEDMELSFSEGFMNNSGDVFNGVFSKENEDEKKKIIVIYDDIALPFGEIRISFDRGDGGHNGIKDVVRKIKTKEFVRIRIGVCPKDFFGKCRKPKGGDALNKYLVHKKLSKKKIEIYNSLAEKVEDILKIIIKEGCQKAMNKYN